MRGQPLLSVAGGGRLGFLTVQTLRPSQAETTGEWAQSHGCPWRCLSYDWTGSEGKKGRGEEREEWWWERKKEEEKWFMEDEISICKWNGYKGGEGESIYLYLVQERVDSEQWGEGRQTKVKGQRSIVPHPPTTAHLLPCLVVNNSNIKVPDRLHSTYKLGREERRENRMVTLLSHRFPNCHQTLQFAN